MDELKALGESRDRNKDLYQFQKPDSALLERFATPRTNLSDENFGKLVVTVSVEEFTSLCPITSQPDYAELVIDYEPDQWCVESKSLKLFLIGYRNYGAFHETVVWQVCDALVQLLNPKTIQVRGNFRPRGGIAFVPTASWVRSI